MTEPMLVNGRTVSQLLADHRAVYGEARMEGEGGEGGTGEGGEGGTGEGGTGESPYAEYLGKLPETVRPLVEPIFKEWDGNVTKRFQGVHDQYEPWKPVLDLGYDPDSVRQALTFAEALNSNPKDVITTLLEAYPDVKAALTQAAVPPAGGGQEEEPDPYADKFTQLEQGFTALAQLLLQQQQQQQYEQQNTLLSNTMKQLHEKHGAFDDNYVMSLMATGIKPEAAVDKFKEVVKQHAAELLKPGSQAPTVLGQGGGVPSGAIDPATLGNGDTKKLVAELLAAAAKTG